MAALGERRSGLSHRQYLAAWSKLGVALASADAPECPGRMAGRNDLRSPSRLRCFCSLGFRVEKYTISTVLSFKYLVLLERKNGRDSVFFNSETQATEAAQTGWTAKIIAASHAPRTFTRISTRQSNTEFPPCSKILTM